MKVGIIGRTGRWCLGLSLALAFVAAGCTQSADEPDIPAQQFSTPLELIGKTSGDLFGRIIFPNEYSQRSTTFSVSGRPFVTQPDGQFWVTGIPRGKHTLLVHVKGYEPLEQPVTVGEGETRLEEGLALRAARGQVNGRVVSDSGITASGVALHLTPEGGSTASSADGRFRFMGVGSGKYTLSVNDPRFQPVEQVFRLDSNETVDLGNIVLFRNPARRTPETASIR